MKNFKKGDKIFIRHEVYGYPQEVIFLGHTSHNNIENPNRIIVQYEYSYWNSAKRTKVISIDNVI